MPGLQEMLVIAVVALLVFGPDRLPEVARNVGQFVGKLRTQTNKGMAEIRGMSEIQDLQRELQSLRREINGVSSDIKRPLGNIDGSTGGSSGGSSRMVPANQDGGRAVTDGEAGPAAAIRPDETPPPTDPDAT